MLEFLLSGRFLLSAILNVFFCDKLYFKLVQSGKLKTECDKDVRVIWFYFSPNMTSSNFNIGFEGSKPCLRVLKSPGGGHTDIFGIHSKVEEGIIPNKRKIVRPTAVSHCFVGELEKLDSKNSDEEKPSEERNGNNQEIDENTEPQNKTSDINENSEPKTEEKNETVRRQRVPPGGFSSVLW